MDLTKHSLIEGTEARLLKLSDYLRNLPPERTFSMDTFYDSSYTGGGDATDMEVCGTAACAVGHYAIMEGFDVTSSGVKPVVVTEDWFQKTEEYVNVIRMDWCTFVEKEIGVPTVWLDTPIFDWLFGSDWTGEDNTPEGAAARIDYFLAHGVPEDFVHQEISDYPIGGAKKIYAAYLNPSKGDK